MLELIMAAAFFALLMLVTAIRAVWPRPAVFEVQSMRAALERRVRDGVEFKL